VKARPTIACNAKSRRKVKRRPLGLRAPPRSACRYASIWACQYAPHRSRRASFSNADV